jgi:hypothetical protein
VTIKSLDRIEGKDRIVLARFDEMDWTVIVGIEDFTIGSKTIYIEVNTILPVRPEFEFLRKRCYSERRGGFVIKTMKMGGVLSQGLALPESTFESFGISRNTSSMIDVTSFLGARAIEDEGPSIEKQPSKFERFVDKWFYLIFKKHWIVKTTSSFPSDLVNKTDETQVQNLGFVYELWAGKNVYSTVKMDGSSLTCILNKGRFIVTSRNTRLYDAPIRKAKSQLNPNHMKRYRDNAFLYVMAKYNVPAMMWQYYKTTNKRWFALSGELCGPAIQKNRIGLSDYEWFVFNFEDVKDRRFHKWTNLVVMAARCGFSTVPHIETRIFDFKNLDELRNYARGSYPNGHPREGVVIRLCDPLDKYIPEPQGRMSNMSSFKIINEDFRLKVEG